MLGVLLLFKIPRNLIEFKPFKTSWERIFFSIRNVPIIKCLLGVGCKLSKYVN